MTDPELACVVIGLTFTLGMGVGYVLAHWTKDSKKENR